VPSRMWTLAPANGATRARSIFFKRYMSARGSLPLPRRRPRGPDSPKTIDLLFVRAAMAVATRLQARAASVATSTAADRGPGGTRVKGCRFQPRAPHARFVRIASG
jgi:hypothetical protein